MAGKDKQDFKGSLGSAHKSKRFWQLTTIVSVAVVSLLAVTNMRQAHNHQAILVPYGTVSMNNQVKVTGKIQQDAVYLGMLARADISTLLNWQPNNIDRQMQQFEARLTPAAYANYSVQLETDAKKFKSGNVSESFYINEMKFNAPNQIKVSGRIKRWSGHDLTIATDVAYTITYKQTPDGLYAIDNFESKN